MKIIKIIISLAVTGLVVWYLLFFVLTGQGTSFYKDCEKIAEGMNRQEVLNIFDSYFISDRYETKNDQNGIFVYKRGPMNDYQCDIDIDNDMVVRIHAVFD